MNKIIPLIIAFFEKYGVYIIGFIAVLFIWRKLFTGGFIKNKVQTSYDESGVNISQQQALAYAENLYTAMAGVGTDDNVLRQVYSVLSGHPENTKAVYNAFGYRDYALFGAPQYFWIPSDKVNLKQWIKNETSGRLHDDWMSLFNAAGII